MPTILNVFGWRIFFYANEGKEPIHVHCVKGEKECKYWLDRTGFDVREDFSYGMGEKDKREVKKILFEYFDFIESQWDEFQRRKIK